jgi:NifB/MoaA-like Fe-S oxidoreductase
MDESRLDRIERILTETATITRETAALSRENAAQIAVVNKAQDACFVALKNLIESQELLMKTLDRLAQLWGRSPN